MDRLTLEQINNMTESQMREYLRGMEVENQRKDEAARIEAEEERKRKEEAKRETVNSIMNISAVSEETSANATQVDSNAKMQQNLVDELKKSVELLSEKATQMEETVGVLKVE